MTKQQLMFALEDLQAENDQLTLDAGDLTEELVIARAMIEALWERLGVPKPKPKKLEILDETALDTK